MTVDLFIIIADRIARSFPMPSAIQVPPLIQVFPGERNHGCCKKKTKKASLPYFNGVPSCKNGKYVNKKNNKKQRNKNTL